MVGRAPVDQLQVDVGFGGLSKGAEEILEQLGLEVTNAGRGEFPMADAVSATGEIEGGGGEAIVHRHEEIARAENAALIAEGLFDGVAKGDANVFDGMVLIDIEIALGAKMEIESTVASDLLEHVIKEADTGGNVGFATPVEVETKCDVRFLRGAAEDGFSHRSGSRARSRRVIWGGVPTVMRT